MESSLNYLSLKRSIFVGKVNKLIIEYWKSIVGIICLGFGLYLQSGYLLVGVLVITLGYFLILFDNFYQNRITRKKLDDFSSTLEKAKSIQPNNQEIQKIHSEYTDWAEGFILRKEKKKIEMDEILLTENKIKQKLNEKWRIVYILCIEIVKSLAAAAQ